MTYRAAVAWLYAQQVHGIKLGLANMQRLSDALGLHLSGPAAPAFLHVAGTNGKGSVCAMLDAIFRAAGVRSGLYTSPHLVTFRERLRLEGAMIPEPAVAEGLNRIRELTSGWDHPPTFFEVTTALALGWFQAERATVVALETGLGGRLDATNVVTPVVAVLTSIALDHTQFLGGTAAQIAEEKCGIIKPGVPVVSAPQVPEVEAVIRRVAAERGSPCSFAKGAPSSAPTGLAGAHQAINAAVALEALSVATRRSPALRVSEAQVAEGLRAVRWPGRFQLIGERWLLDGAHNPAAAATLAAAWRERFGPERATVILGVMRDKDAAAIVAALAPIAARFLAVAVANERALQPGELATIIRTVAPEVGCAECAEPASAMRAAEASPGRTLVTGSLFLVGEVLAQLGLAEGAAERSVQ